MEDTVVSKSEFFQRQDDLISKVLPNSLLIIPNNLTSVRSNDTLLLTLEVIDDDDDFSTITVELSRSDKGNDFPIAIIVLLISILFFVSSIFYSRRTDDMQIPKWND